MIATFLRSERRAMSRVHSRRLPARLRPQPGLRRALRCGPPAVVRAGLRDARAAPEERARGGRWRRVRRRSGQLICDHALFHLEADLRRLELTAARLDALGKEVAA